MQDYQEIASDTTSMQATKILATYYWNKKYLIFGYWELTIQFFRTIQMNIEFLIFILEEDMF